VPSGSDYQGPPDALERYAAVVEGAGAKVQGAKNPYTSHNGHMYSFLASDGAMALRLSDDLADEFLATYESGPVTQYGAVMRGYVAVPDTLLSDTDELVDWFHKSLHWIGTLDPKPTKKGR
jgi:TfoX/Sxy family transcriptional regulator of competence genes